MPRLRDFQGVRSEVRVDGRLNAMTIEEAVNLRGKGED
jgi:hypothetical protein